jgi:hypothetical protein
MNRDCHCAEQKASDKRRGVQFEAAREFEYLHLSGFCQLFGQPPPGGIGRQ